ncbi:uncharacterized protein L201_004111 [Kwoniella dendrophila CBS 6074]|uniref:Uncharacterized protein n=1 Tax=Kwoniella dendrophila CBS 6074 TaxID=1295534 RepID=A0AAX4JWA6_9TREE
MSPPASREKLDVESPQAREARLGGLLSSISTPNAAVQSTPAVSSFSNPIPSKPTALPESDALARVRAFLPQFRASNEELLARAAENPDSVDMEKINGGQAIAMDLGLGIFDAPQNPKSDLGPTVDSRPPADLAQDDEDDEDEEESDDTEDSSSDSSSDGDSASEEEKRSQLPLKKNT